MKLTRSIYSLFFFGLVFLNSITCGSKQDITSDVTVNKDSIVMSVRQYYPDYAILQLENLGEDLQKYLKMTYGNGKPGIIQDDYDGDGFTDYALLLLLKTTAKTAPLEKLVVLRGKENGMFIPIDLYSFGSDIDDSDLVKNIFIRRIPPGEVEEWNHSGKVFIKYPGIEWVNWESSSCVYFWQDGEFRNIWTSD